MGLTFSFQGDTLVSPRNIVSSNIGRALNVSHSDDRIFEHPEVTIKPSALDDEIQRRLLTLKTSNTTESLLDQQGEISVPNILEHPDMRGPVVMLTPNTSSSSSALLLANDQKRIIRQQSGRIVGDEHSSSERVRLPSRCVHHTGSNTSFRRSCRILSREKF